MSHEDAGSTYGVPKQTVSRWMAGNGADRGALDPKVGLVKKDLADKLETLANKIVDAAASKIEDATLPGSMTAAAIAIDKMRLLREQSTSITATISREERVERLSEEFARLGLRPPLDSGGAGNEQPVTAH